MVEAFQHVCISCRDIERSIRFHEARGLLVRHPGEVNLEGSARAFNLPSVRLKVVQFVPPSAASKVFIDLVQWVEPSATGESYPSLTHAGLTRLALRVSDIDATTASLREKGFSFLSHEPRCCNKPDKTATIPASIAALACAWPGA